MIFAKFSPQTWVRNIQTNELGLIQGPPYVKDGDLYYSVAVSRDSILPPVLGSDRISEWPENDLEPAKQP